MQAVDRACGPTGFTSRYHRKPRRITDDYQAWMRRVQRGDTPSMKGSARRMARFNSAGRLLSARYVCPSGCGEILPRVPTSSAVVQVDSVPSLPCRYTTLCWAVATMAWHPQSLFVIPERRKTCSNLDRTPIQRLAGQDSLTKSEELCLQTCPMTRVMLRKSQPATNTLRPQP